MSQQFEFQSRLKVNLKTADGFYDQGMAVTQGIINSSFEGLYNRYTALQKIEWDNDDAEMNADLLPSRILIPQSVGVNLAKINHQIRFKSGTLKKKSPTRTYKLDGWMVTVVCDLDQQFVKRHPADKESKTEKAQREFIENEFDVPGDYRIERLYAKLTSANWNNFDMDQSKFIIDGTEMSYDDWKDDDDKAASAFSSLCSSWARDMNKRGLTTLGIKVTLPDIDLKENPTFSPTSMIHQIYPYRDAGGKTTTGFTPLGNANCLLYLEKVGGASLPDAKQVGFSGNFCHPAAGQLPEVSGSFVVTQPLFIERFLLPQLQAMNQATTVYVAPLWGSANGWAFPYDVGVDPDYPSHTSSVYEFHKNSDGTTYVYTRNIDKSKGPINDQNIHSGKTWWQSEHWSKASTTFTQTTGTNKMELKGTFEYCRGIKISSHSSMSNPEHHSYELYSGKWNIGITMATSNSGIELTLGDASNSDNPMHLEMTGEMTESESLQAYHTNETKLRDRIGDNMKQRLKELRKSLNDGFHSSGRFVYCGAGQLDFSQPLFTNDGAVIANVAWKPIPAEKKVLVNPLANAKAAGTSAKFASLQNSSYSNNPMIPHPSKLGKLVVATE
ncbi:heterokaryon incompatibility protein-domain-containing protein [Apiospora arundinis]